MEQFRNSDFWEKAKTSERFQEILAEFLQTYEEKKRCGNYLYARRRLGALESENCLIRARQGVL